MTSASTVRTRLAQIEVRPGRPDANAARMLETVRNARRDKIELLVFPEMALPGYLIGDEWERASFLRECEACGRDIRAASEGLTVVFGNVGLDWDRRNEDGRVRKYNALFVAQDGEFVPPVNGPYPFAVKTLLPNYRTFDDSRHFFDLRKLAFELDRRVSDLVTPIPTAVGSLGCVLCEDGWDLDYGVSPLRLLAAHRPDLYINISASPYTLSKNHKRNRVFSDQARLLERPLLYVNHVGIQNTGKTVFTFDGASCVYDGHGHAAALDRPFEEDELTLDVPRDGRTAFGEPTDLKHDGIPEACHALLYGTGRFMDLCGVHRVVVGISGGVHSCVVAAL